MFRKNILIIGDHNSGKTSYVNRILTGEFAVNHIPTTEIRNTIYTLGSKEFNLIEANFENYENFIENYEEDISGIIIFYDRTTRVKENIMNEIVEFFQHIPTIICGNKNEYKYISKRKLYEYKNKHDKEHIFISVKSNEKYIEPILFFKSKIEYMDPNL